MFVGQADIFDGAIILSFVKRIYLPGVLEVFLHSFSQLSAKGEKIT